MQLISPDKCSYGFKNGATANFTLPPVCFFIACESEDKHVREGSKGGERGLKKEVREVTEVRNVY